MFLFNIEDIWELGGSYKATKILKKKRGLIYTEGLLKVGRGFEREISAKAVFDNSGHGGILSIDNNNDFEEACKYFNDHIANNSVILENMRMRFQIRKGIFLKLTYFLGIALFLLFAIICQIAYICMGSVPPVMTSILRNSGTVILIVTSLCLIIEGMKIFLFNRYYM